MRKMIEVETERDSRYLTGKRRRRQGVLREGSVKNN